MIHWILSSVLSLLMVVPLQIPPVMTVIEGQVLQADSPEPVPIEYARIDLQSGPNSSIFSRTDAAGRFRFNGVPSGQYKLIVMAAGYVATEYGQRAAGQPGAPLSVTPGAQIDPFVFRLVRTATITGRIHDSEDLPLAGVPVQVMRATYAADGRRNLTPVTFTRTDDRGVYRLYWLTPDEYYISAAPSVGRSGPAFTPLNPNQPASRPGYPSWMYPGVPDLAHAIPVRLKPGELRDGIDFRFSLMPTVHVSGTVIDQKTGNGVSAEIYFSQQGEVRGNVMQALSDSSGKFNFPGVAPGAYSLGAFSDTLQLSRTMTIDVPDKDISNINVVLEAGFSIRGRVIPDPGDTALTLPQLSVGLIPGGSAQIQPDGTFEIKDLHSGSFSVYVFGLTEDLYIKSVQFGRSNAMTDALPDPGEIRPAASVRGVLAPMTPGQILVGSDSKDTLDIVISADSGRIRGIVTNAADAPSSAARVVLVPEEKLRGIRPYYQVTTSDQNGAFSIRGIPPGSYTLFAWDSVDAGAYYNRDFMRPFESRGVPVQIEPKMETVSRARLLN